MKYAWSFVVACIMLLGLSFFSQSALAYDNIGLELSPEGVSVCPGSGAESSLYLTVTNNDDTIHTYFLSLEMPDGWKTPDNGFIQPETLPLLPGESDEIVFWVNPPSVEPGIYDVYVKAGNGEENSKKLEVEVLHCHDVSIDVDEMVDVCKDTEFEYSADITNNGKDAEEFEVIVSGSWSDEDLHKESFELESGETEEIAFDVTSPTESGTITVKAESKESYASAESDTQVNVENCYDFEVKIEPEEVQGCFGDSSNFVLVVTNLGTESDKYDMRMPDWVVPSQETVTALPGEEKDVGLFAYPEMKGKTDFDVTVTSQEYQQLKKTATGTVEAIECKGVAVIVSPDGQDVCGGTSAELEVSVKNTGMVSDTYDLKSDIGTLEKNKVSIDSGEIEDVVLTVDTAGLEIGENTVTVIANNDATTDQNTVSLHVKNCYSVEFGVTPENPEVCMEDVINYVLVLKNTGEIEDSYMFMLEDLEIGNASLQPGEMKMFSTNLKIDYLEGEYNLTFKAVSEHVSEEAVSHVTVKGDDVCYDVELSSDDILSTVEPGSGIALGIKVKNTGERPDNFVFVMEGPEWAHLSETLVSLEGDEETYIYLYASPGYDVGKETYDVSIKTESTNSMEEMELRIGVGVEPEPFGEEEETEGDVTVETGVPTGQVTQFEVSGETGKVALLAVIVVLIIIILAVKFVLFVK